MCEMGDGMHCDMACESNQEDRVILYYKILLVDNIFHDFSTKYIFHLRMEIRQLLYVLVNIPEILVKI